MRKLHVFYQDRNESGVSIVVAEDENEARELLRENCKFYDSKWPVKQISLAHRQVVIDNRGGDVLAITV